MTISRHALGRWGEAMAAEFLEHQGYLIIDRNCRTPYGEIDLVAQDGAVLVFVEVKTRTSDAFGFPEESITPKKQEHLISAAQAILQSMSNQPNSWRIDVIAIRKLKSVEQPEIVHFKNAVN
ncbi:MAG: YraN family protein [Anaerolineales bacterium]|jgi:putative endonuclease